MAFDPQDRLEGDSCICCERGVYEEILAEMTTTQNLVGYHFTEKKVLAWRTRLFHGARQGSAFFL